MILSTNYDVCVCVRVLLGENLISAEALVTAKNINKIFNMHYIFKFNKLIQSYEGSYI